MIWYNNVTHILLYKCYKHGWLDYNMNGLSFGERTPVRLSYKTCELEKPDDQTCWASDFIFDAEIK